MRSFVPILLTVAYLIAVPGCQKKPRELPISALERKTTTFFKAGQFSDALRYADQWCERIPDDYDPVAIRCFIHIELDNRGLALDDAILAHELRPGDVESLRLRGFPYSLNGMHIQAIADMKAVIDQSMNSCVLQVERFGEYEKLGDYETAINHLKRGLSYDKRNASAWNALSRIHSMAATPDFLDSKKAKRYAARAVKYSTSDVDGGQSWDSLGAALAESGDFERAR